jgi:flagellar FliL protein
MCVEIWLLKERATPSMQDLLSQLDPPFAIGLIVVGLLALIGVVLLARRRRRRIEPDESESQPSTLGGMIDYTTLQDEEPQGWRDRFRNLSLAGKILVALIPLLALLGLAVLILLTLPNEPTAGPPPTPVPVSLTVTKADLVRVDPEQAVLIEVETTGLSNDTALVAEMLADGEPFPWLNAEQARGTIINNRAEIRANRADGAPIPQQNANYTVIVRTSDGQTVGEAPLLTAPFTDAFFSGGAPTAQQPTATPAPTATPQPTPAPGATPEPEPEPEPEPTLPTGPAGNVANGGNVRALPQITADNVIGGVNAGEEVQLLARTPNQAWYRVRTVRDEVGWVSATLLTIDPAVAAQIPTAAVVSVFQNGPVFEQPDLNSTQIDRVNAAAVIANSEVVELLRKTADGAWYEVVNARNVTGWVQAELLGIPPEVAEQVPVAEE